MYDVSLPIADAIVDALSAHDFGVSLSVSREWNPERKMADGDLDDAVVYLTPRDASENRMGGEVANPERRREIGIDLTFLQRVDTSDAEAVDALAELSAEIHDYATAAARYGATWRSTSMTQDEQRLRHHGVFQRRYAIQWNHFD